MDPRAKGAGEGEDGHGDAVSARHDGQTKNKERRRASVIPGTGELDDERSSGRRGDHALKMGYRGDVRRAVLLEVTAACAAAVWTVRLVSLTAPDLTCENRADGSGIPSRGHETRDGAHAVPQRCHQCSTGHSTRSRVAAGTIPALTVTLRRRELRVDELRVVAMRTASYIVVPPPRKNTATEHDRQTDMFATGKICSQFAVTPPACPPAQRASSVHRTAFVVVPRAPKALDAIIGDMIMAGA